MNSLFAPAARSKRRSRKSDEVGKASTSDAIENVEEEQHAEGNEDPSFTQTDTSEIMDHNDAGSAPN
jgi:hypothetical protein